MDQVAAIIADIHNEDVDGVRQRLLDLILTHPANWRDLLMTSADLPSPSSYKTKAAHIDTLVQAASDALEDPRLDLGATIQLNGIATAMEDLSERRRVLLHELTSVEQDSGPSDQLLGLAAAAQAAAVDTHTRTLQNAVANGQIDRLAMLKPSATSVGGTPIPADVGWAGMAKRSDISFLQFCRWI
jgi:hypothetical protein